MYTASKSDMALLPAVFVLGNTEIHVCASNSSNMTTNVETSVNKHFSIGAILRVLDINLDNHYIRLWECFDNIWMQS